MTAGILRTTYLATIRICPRSRWYLIGRWSIFMTNAGFSFQAGQSKILFNLRYKKIHVAGKEVLRRVWHYFDQIRCFFSARHGVLSSVHRLREQKDNNTNAVFTPPRLRYGRTADTIKPRSRPTCYCPLSFFSFLPLSSFSFRRYTHETFFTLHNDFSNMYFFSSLFL